MLIHTLTCASQNISVLRSENLICIREVMWWNVCSWAGYCCAVSVHTISPFLQALDYDYPDIDASAFP